MATEDIPYNVSEFATPEPEKQDDVDQPNKSVLLDVKKYLDKAIADANTLDGIDLAEKNKMTPTQQIAVYKLLIIHLKNTKSIIDDKIRGLR